MESCELVPGNPSSMLLCVLTGIAGQTTCLHRAQKASGARFLRFGASGRMPTLSAHLDSLGPGFARATDVSRQRVCRVPRTLRAH